MSTPSVFTSPRTMCLFGTTFNAKSHTCVLSTFSPVLLPPHIVCKLGIGTKSKTLSTGKQLLYTAVRTLLFGKKLIVGGRLDKGEKVMACRSEIELCWEVCGREVLDYRFLELDREVQKRWLWIRGFMKV